MTRTLHEYDELGPRAPQQPVSALFHEHTKLTERRLLDFRERIEAGTTEPPEAKSYPTRPNLELPRTRRTFLGARFDDVLRARRSHRDPFVGGPIGARALATLLDLSLGPTAGGLRAWPSAGARYPLEAYLVALACEGVSPGLYHYDPLRNALAALGACPPRSTLSRLVFAGGPSGDRWDRAAAALVLTAVFERTQAKYGERGYRFVLLEAGHAAQNVLLVASAIGLAAVPLGGFCEDALGDLFGLDRALESPVYVVLFGCRS